MTPEQALNAVLSIFDSCDIPYMITGSFASNIHGVPRTTYDADIVVEVTRQTLDRFIDRLGDNFYVSPEAAREALARRRMFNIVHLESGLKVDLVIRKDRSFSIEEFSRRVQFRFLDEQRWFASAEDIILAKLEWSKMGESERQFQDALNVARIQHQCLDHTYLSKWAEILDLEEYLQRLIISI